MRYKEIKVNVEYHKVDAQQDGYQPKLYAYLLDQSPELPDITTRPAVIICPGGGYIFKSDREAEPIAMRLLAAGIHAFVLQYSVAPSRYPSAALELAAAVRLVRQNAIEFAVDTNRVFIMGFSAGGHLCATLGTLWDEPVFEQAFGIEQGKNWRPDGMLLSYPVITMGEFAHKGSRDSLLGANASRERTDALSLEKRVNPKTPPTFLWHTVNDDTVPVENSLLFATALRKAEVPFEMHLYESGVHGLSLCDETTAEDEHQLAPDNAGWMELAIRWMKRSEDRTLSE